MELKTQMSSVRWGARCRVRQSTGKGEASCAASARLTAELPHFWKQLNLRRSLKIVLIFK